MSSPKAGAGSAVVVDGVTFTVDVGDARAGYAAGVASASPDMLWYSITLHLSPTLEVSEQSLSLMEFDPSITATSESVDVTSAPETDMSPVE